MAAEGKNAVEQIRNLIPLFTLPSKTSPCSLQQHCRENKPFSNSNQSLVSPMVTRLGPVGFSQRPDPVRTFAGELAEDTFKQAKT